ncbi:hypothetical protein BDA96_10G109100 [Sorghum bicolor]|uniref:Uncharacterized protein n=1 Tax=Sorghum bicolor TaxID=4558 RepID=A0A921Q197_SORBI|nr:hypothetical protein BDA96_10G109100 [Sorghum bicolor]
MPANHGRVCYYMFTSCNRVRGARAWGRARRALRRAHHNRPRRTHMQSARATTDAGLRACGAAPARAARFAACSRLQPAGRPTTTGAGAGAGLAWPGPSPARNLRPTRKRSRAVSSSLARGPPAARASVPRPTARGRALLVTGHSSCRRSASADRCVVSIRSPSSVDAGAAARGPAGRWLKASRPVRVAANLPHGNELQLR